MLAGVIALTKERSCNLAPAIAFFESNHCGDRRWEPAPNYN